MHSADLLKSKMDKLSARGLIIPMSADLSSLITVSMDIFIANQRHMLRILNIMEINQDRKNDLDFYITKFCSVVKEIYLDGSVRYEINSIKWLCHQESSLYETEIHIVQLALLDLFKCIISLGHDISLNNKESTALFIVYKNLLSVYNYPMDDSSIEQYFKKYSKVPILEISESSTFAIADILGRRYCEALRSSYLIALYRLSILISKADEKITEQEEDWINHIKSRHISKYDYNAPMKIYVPDER